MDIAALAQGLLIPFLGTTLGAATVFFLKDQIPPTLQKILVGFAAGVMVSASFWGLLLPAVEQSGTSTLAFLPATIGFLAGMGFLLLLDTLTPHMHLDNKEEGIQSGISKTAKLVLAITIHNIPEGMAVGIILADWAFGDGSVSYAAALALAIGIALQNFPEGAVVSTPLLAQGVSKPKTFFYGVLTGAVEPIAALITILAAETVLPAMPYLLSFAAGAMIYVVVEELIPEMSEGKHSNVGTVAFAIGFALMMVLDVALG